MVLNTIHNQTKQPNNSLPPRVTLRIFFLISAIAGIASLVGILMLPPSESKNSFVEGFSLLRLSIWAFHLFGILFFLWMFVRAYTSVNWATNFEQKIKTWGTQNTFQSTFFLCVVVGLIIGLSGLDFLLNPDRFPRTILYMFLYIRIRPMLLWLVTIVTQLLLLIIIHRWTIVSLRDFFPQTRLAYYGAAGVIAEVLSNIALWVDFANNPSHLLDGTPQMIGVIIFLIVLLFISLFLLSFQGKQKLQ